MPDPTAVTIKVFHEGAEPELLPMPIVVDYERWAVTEQLTERGVSSLFVVTHKRSGYCAPGAWTWRKAVARARELDAMTVIDWDVVDPEDMPEYFREHPSVLRELERIMFGLEVPRRGMPW